MKYIYTILFLLISTKALGETCTKEQFLASMPDALKKERAGWSLEQFRTGFIYDLVYFRSINEEALSQINALEIDEDLEKIDIEKVKKASKTIKNLLELEGSSCAVSEIMNLDFIFINQKASSPEYSVRTHFKRLLSYYEMSEKKYKNLNSMSQGEGEKNKTTNDGFVIEKFFQKGELIEMIVSVTKKNFVTCVFKDSNGRTAHVVHELFEPPAARINTFVRGGSKIASYECVVQ